MGRTRYSSLGIAASCRRMAVKVMKNPLIIHGTLPAKTGTTIIKLLTKFKKELSLNGNCVFSLVSHSRGSPHLFAFIRVHSRPHCFFRVTRQNHWAANERE